LGDGKVWGEHKEATEPCNHEYPLKQAENKILFFAQHGDERKSYKGEMGDIRARNMLICGSV